MSKVQGRPRKFSHQQGVDAATILFNKHGYQGVPITEICNTIGITATSLYATYGSKFGLYTEVVRAYTQSNFSAFSGAIEQTESVESLFRAVLEKAVSLYASNPQQPGCLLLDGAINNADPKVKQLINERNSQFSAIINDKLAALGAENAAEFTSFIVTLVRGLSSASRNGASQHELMMTVEFYCSLVEY